MTEPKRWIEDFAAFVDERANALAEAIAWVLLGIDDRPALDDDVTEEAN